MNNKYKIKRGIILKEEIYGVIAFDSTHHAIKGEKLLSDFKDIMTIPTPREITASCGLALRTSLDNIPEVINIIKEESLNILGIYKLRKRGLKKDIEKIDI